MACRERGLLTTILLAGPESRRAEAIYENFSVCRAQSSRDADGGFSTRRNCRLYSKHLPIADPLKEIIIQVLHCGGIINFVYVLQSQMRVCCCFGELYIRLGWYRVG